jgi:hypothetical protein
VHTSHTCSSFQATKTGMEQCMILLDIGITVPMILLLCA